MLLPILKSGKHYVHALIEPADQQRAILLTTGTIKRSSFYNFFMLQSRRLLMTRLGWRRRSGKEAVAGDGLFS